MTEATNKQYFKQRWKFSDNTFYSFLCVTPSNTLLFKTVVPKQYDELQLFDNEHTLQ